MILDANECRSRIPDIIAFTRHKTDAERYEFMSLLAIATNIHIILTACYLGELYGFSPKLDSFILRMMRFYTISDVINVRRLDENNGL